MKAAKIMLFEDMIYDRYVKKALDEAGYTYLDSGDGIGRLKENILSGTTWDLVIIASEGQYTVQGEFFDYIKMLLDQGSSVITEMWILDWVKNGRIQPILEQCGISYQSNWVNPSNRDVYWVDPNHPLATEPNAVSLSHFRLYWRGDVGDLVMKVPGSPAQIVASANAANSERDGLITVCYDGRLILQTFASHDHFQSEMVKLWQNYIYYALKTRILGSQK